VEAYPAQVPDLYRGEPVLVAAKLGRQELAGTVIVSGRSVDEHWQRQLDLPLHDEEQGAHAGISSLWARDKIAGLMDEKILGKPEPEVRSAVLPVALEHQLVSPYTSFVAVEQRRSRPPEEGLASAAVPNLPPAGQSPQPFAWPRTATTAPLQLTLGSLLLLLALVFQFLFRSYLSP
jgi:Ca-activated chloride channel family protein